MQPSSSGSPEAAARRSPSVQLVPGMRIAGHLDAQRVDGGVCAAQQSAQIGPTKGKIHGLLRPSDDADASTVGRKHPDAARPRAIDAADAVHLETIWNAGLAAFVHVRKDAAPDHVAGDIELERVDVL